jgi:ferredoxin--NADP+ reductase
VILRLDEAGERFPLTVVEKDEAAGTITLIVQEAGRSTMDLASLPAGASLSDVVGPLGNPTEVGPFGRCVAIGGGVGIAEVLPIARALRAAGNRVIGIIGARGKGLLILEEEMRSSVETLYVTTDDGSYARKGFVTDVLRERLAGAERPDYVFAVGPVPMMRAVAETTRSAGIRTVVSLNPIMVDGTGMCGACRVSVGGETLFACVDGPEFDAHQVDFDLLTQRLKLYRSQERESAQCRCRRTGGKIG